MTEASLQLWSDNEAEIDLLRFGYLADAVARIVAAPDLLPVTVGVFGDWGGGKSTLMQLARQLLDQQEGVLTLTFNGWLFEGYEDAKAALMGTILDSIEDALQGTTRWTDALRNRITASRLGCRPSGWSCATAAPSRSLATRARASWGSASMP